MAEIPLKTAKLCAINGEVSNTSAAESASEENEIFDNLVWLTTAEAAKYLRKTTGAIRTAVSRRQLRARKWRRRLFFKKSELNRLLEDSFSKGEL